MFKILGATSRDSSQMLTKRLAASGEENEQVAAARSYSAQQKAALAICCKAIVWKKTSTLIP